MKKKVVVDLIKNVLDNTSMYFEFYEGIKKEFGELLHLKFIKFSIIFPPQLISFPLDHLNCAL